MSEPSSVSSRRGRARRHRWTIWNVARVELSAAAVEDLDELIARHELPLDTLARVRGHSACSTGSCSPAALWRAAGTDFESWADLAMDGLVYAYIEADDRVVVITVRDARTSSAPPRRSRPDTAPTGVQPVHKAERTGGKMSCRFACRLLRKVSRFSGSAIVTRVRSRRRL